MDAELFPRERTRVAPGAVHLPDWLDGPAQRRLLDACREWARPPAGLRTVRTPGGGTMTARQVCLGRHWYPYGYAPTVVDGDGSPVKPFPAWLGDLARRAVRDTLGGPGAAYGTDPPGDAGTGALDGPGAVHGGDPLGGPGAVHGGDPLGDSRNGALGGPGAAYGTDPPGDAGTGALGGPGVVYGGDPLGDSRNGALDGPGAAYGTDPPGDAGTGALDGPGAVHGGDPLRGAEADALDGRRAAHESGLLGASAAGAYDIALINFYDGDARMGMHRDSDEKSHAPVVSLSLGDTCVFRFGNTRTRTRPCTDVELRSGDLFVFGGPARLAFHGVPKVLPGTGPPQLGLTGRLNITLRVSGL